jgi:hypothetical protein
MSVTADYVRDLFGNLETGKLERFFSRVADDVDWTVMGTHPLAGHYTSKSELIERTFARIERIMKEGIVLKVNHVVVSGDEASVEMESLSVARNGRPFNNTYCWVVRFLEGEIVEVRAYVDSALVQLVLDENES